MAKKKTAPPDSTTTSTTPTAAPRRRTTAKPNEEAATSQASAVAEAFDAGGSAAAVSGNRASGNGHSSASPSYDEIAEAAYRRYLSRGGDHGRDFDDWVEAERELRERTNRT